MFAICVTTTFADVSVDWLQDGTATGTHSALDKNDNVFVTSWDGSVYLRKFDKFGVFQWENNYTTPLLFNYLYPTNVFADTLGNVVVVGYRYTAPTEGRNANAIFVLKYDASGILLWEKIIEGTFSFFNNSLYRTNVSSVMDISGNVFIGSAGNVSGYPTTGFNAIKVTTTGAIGWVSAINISGTPYHFVSSIRLNGSRLVLSGHTQYWLANAVVWVLDINGISKWSKTEVGIGGKDAIIDNSGKVFLLTTSLPGYDSDISLYRYKSNGASLWHNTYDFGGAEIGARLKLGPDNKLVVLGYGTQTGISLYVDWLTIKINLDGGLIWSKRYDQHTNNDEIPYDIAVDVDGDIFVTGIGGPFPGGFNLGARQFVTVKYKSNGTLIWTYALDTLNEYLSGREINIDSRSNIYVSADVNSLVFHLLDNTGTDPCLIPSGISVAGITTTAATISWAPVDNAYLYHIRYKTITSPIWTVVSTDATTINIDGLITGTAYQYEVEAICDSGPTGYSSTATFTTLGTTYCASGGLNAANDWIDLVYVSDMLNSTPTSAGGYSDFTYLSVTMVQGSTYSMTLSAGMVGGPYTEYWNVWIDFNADGDFTDIGESVVAYNSNQIGWESHNITIPPTAITGNTKMRVSMKRGSAAASCGSFAKGETEDYTVTILPGKLYTESSSKELSLTVFPNPAHDYIQLALENAEAINEICITDINGSQHLCTVINSNNPRIDINQLIPGIYFIVATNPQGNKAIGKFIKQ